MSEHSQSSEHPVRIVYHAENRTFARLFNEHCLDEVKDVVRRKLGLAQGTDVSLKQQAGSGALLDLDDDDDFRAFCVLLKSSMSVDIQVTVSGSRGSTVPPQVASPPREQLSVSEPTTVPSLSPSRQPAHPAASDPSGAHPEGSRATQASTAAVKTPGPSNRKRKVSFDGDASAGHDKPVKRRTTKKVVPVTPVASAETTKGPITPGPVSAEEPPKKKQKKEVTKAKVVQSTEAVQSSSIKAISDTPKPKSKKSVALGRGGQVETGTPADPVTLSPPAKKSVRRKKDDGAGLKKSSAPVDQDGMNQPISESNDPVNEASPQPVKPKRAGAVNGASKTRKSEKTKAPKGTACAAIPRTSESTDVQSEVAAAILSDYLSKASETVPPEPPVKQKSAGRITKKSSATSSALLPESATVSATAANHVPAKRRLEYVVLTDAPPPQTPGSSGLPCPICLEEPFHIRYSCPTVLKGPDAIRKRLDELKKTSKGDQQSLIKELEGLLRSPKVASKSSLAATLIDGAQSREAPPPPSASPPRTPSILSNSHMSEVTVESRNKGYSSDSADDTSGGEVEHTKLPAPQSQPSPASYDLDAVIRGPAPKRQSILHLIDRIVGDDDGMVSDSEVDEPVLEEDPDEKVDRSRRRLSRHTDRSSASEDEDEESGSPSSSRSHEGSSNNQQSGAQGTHKPAEESAKHQDSDVVTRDSADRPVLEGRDDGSSEETHVGSVDRMDVDVDHELIRDKGATTVVEQLPSSPAPGAQPSVTLGKRQQESEKRGVDPASNRDGAELVASEVPNDAEADPIEPADDLESQTISRSPNADPIEAPFEDVASSFTGVTQSTPKPGVTKRIKTRNGRILDEEAERPVLLEQLTSEATNKVTPLPTKGKSGRKTTGVSASQEPASTRRSARFSSLPPPATSTPTAVALLDRKAKVGIGMPAKTPAKRSKEGPDASQGSSKDDTVQQGARIAPIPPLIGWETLAELSSSPSLQPDGPSMHIDELMSSSPQLDDGPARGRLDDKGKKGRSRKLALSSQAEGSHGKERLFDLSSSQIPFPYSQPQDNLTPTVILNGKEGEETTDSEEEAKESKRKTKLPVRYRSLSQLAAQATLFSPSLHTPVSKSLTNETLMKHVDDEDSSSSSSSDTNEANGSEHIPRGRRAGSMLETKRKKSLLSRISEHH